MAASLPPGCLLGARLFLEATQEGTARGLCLQASPPCPPAPLHPSAQIPIRGGTLTLPHLRTYDCDGAELPQRPLLLLLAAETGVGTAEVGAVESRLHSTSSAFIQSPAGERSPPRLPRGVLRHAATQRGVQVPTQHGGIPRQFGAPCGPTHIGVTAATGPPPPRQSRARAPPGTPAPLRSPRVLPLPPLPLSSLVLVRVSIGFITILDMRSYLSSSIPTQLALSPGLISFQYTAISKAPAARSWRGRARAPSVAAGNDGWGQNIYPSIPLGADPSRGSPAHPQNATLLMLGLVPPQKYHTGQKPLLGKSCHHYVHK